MKAVREGEDLYPALDTPALLLDLPTVKQNIKRTAEAFRRLGLALRPHVKTHKIPELAQLQVAHGAVGITVAKLGEAEVMVDGGVDDILIAYPIVGDHKVERLADLARRCRVSVAVDNDRAAAYVARAAGIAGKSIQVVIEVDTGYRRTGCPPAGAVGLAQRVGELSGVDVTGLMSYSGHIHDFDDVAQMESLIRQEIQVLGKVRDQLAEAGIVVDTLSIGGTMTSWLVQNRLESIGQIVTEIRPGTYIFHDATTCLEGAATTDECALTVLATIVSRQGPDRAIVDCGSKTLSSDRHPRLDSYGLVKGHPDAHLYKLAEEHGFLRLSGGAQALEVGDRVEIVPAHACAVMNLHDDAWAVEAGDVLRRYSIAARGRTQ